MVFSDGFSSSVAKGLALSFLIGFIIRLVPEVLALGHPIGFDTISYAVVAERGVVWSSWSSIFASSWLLYGFLVPVYGLLRVDPFWLLKIVGPVLFGLNTAGVFWFSRRFLSWGSWLAFFASLFFALQLASLRISWDLLRNALGMGLLLFALSFVGKADSRRKAVVFGVLGLLAVLLTSLPLSLSW